MSGWADKVGKAGKVKLQDPHLFAKWYVSASLAFAGLLQPAAAGIQGGVIGMFGLPNSLSHSWNPRDATRFIGRRTYDEIKYFEEADNDAESGDEEEESWMKRIAGAVTNKIGPTRAEMTRDAVKVGVVSRLKGVNAIVLGLGIFSSDNARPRRYCTHKEIGETGNDVSAADEMDAADGGLE